MQRLIPDPADGGNADNPKSTAQADKSAEPKSPAIVKKTPINTPREIALEKTVSRLEDRLKTTEEAVGGIRAWLEDLLPGGKAPPKHVPVAFPAANPAPRKGTRNAIDAEIWGEG